MIAVPKGNLVWQGVLASMAMHAVFLLFLLAVCRDFPHQSINHDHHRLVVRLISPADLLDRPVVPRVVAHVTVDHQDSTKVPKLRTYGQMAEIPLIVNRLPALLRLTPQRFMPKSSASKISVPASVTLTNPFHTRRPKEVDSESEARHSGKFYAALLEQEVEKALRYPRAAKDQNQYGTALVEVWLGDNGHIEKVMLIRSSGSKVLDEEARAVFHRIRPLPPFHIEGGAVSGDFKFLIPVTFRMDDVGWAVTDSRFKHYGAKRLG